ncbi:hypothetical protein GCM10008956_37540 [Deinococcus arenae]|uniref:Uncharacterized protein n=1 Tax=Deinococcus arenae TaxID=1452751 RepID=A0A8H9GSM9_9DEIO|nr:MULTISPECIES: hypothetical protein [Deinococcus]GGM58412.1 hypothetical protein GCM10008956_37540 [Deinococcus arenae]
MTKFYLVGTIPVKIEKRADGTTVVQAFNVQLGRLENNSRYYTMIRRDDTGLVKVITAAEFDAHVAALRLKAS